MGAEAWVWVGNESQVGEGERGFCSQSQLSLGLPVCALALPLIEEKQSLTAFGK